MLQKHSTLDGLMTLRELHDLYKQDISQSPVFFSALRRATIARIIAKCKRKGLRFPRQHVEDMASDCVCRLMERIKRRPDYHIHRYDRVIDNEILHAMYERKKVREEKSSSEAAIEDVLGYVAYIENHEEGAVCVDTIASTLAARRR